MTLFECQLWVFDWKRPIVNFFLLRNLTDFPEFTDRQTYCQTDGLFSRLNTGVIRATLSKQRRPIIFLLYFFYKQINLPPQYTLRFAHTHTHTIPTEHRHWHIFPKEKKGWCSKFRFVLFYFTGKGPGFWSNSADMSCTENEDLSVVSGFGTPLVL